MLVTIILYALALILLLVLATVVVFYRYIKTSNIFKPQKDPNHYELTILLGSGGHTGELSLLLKNLHFDKINRINVLITSTDNSSQKYFENFFQKEILAQLKDKIVYFRISRTNQVKQSYFTALFTTLKSTFDSIRLIRNNLLNTTHFIANGPGTCVPFFFLFFILNKLKLTKIKLVFVESWCRVTSISLSGKIVRFFTDKFIVHWEEQKKKYPWTNYYGKIL